MWRSVFYWSVCLCVFSVTGAYAGPQPEGFPSVYETARHSVVTILTYSHGSSSVKGIGSGFFVTPDTVITNAHVVDNAAYVEVKKNLRDEPIKVLDVLLVDRDVDIALLRTSEAGQPLRLSTEIPETGEPVIVISSPLGLEKTASQGIISGFREHKGKRYLQITASISPGSSGGPILDKRGRVLGMTAFMLDGNHAQNLNFGIPSSVIKQFLSSGSLSGNKKLRVESSEGGIVITD
jgi:S1-C subfamily serine protease